MSGYDCVLKSKAAPETLIVSASFKKMLAHVLFTVEVTPVAQRFSKPLVNCKSLISIDGMLTRKLTCCKEVNPITAKQGQCTAMKLSNLMKRICGG